jgi:PIN domain nuclease of toxin-antitoxin system
MKLLLDTHIWLWYALGEAKLSENLRRAIADPSNELWLSPISIWEALLLSEKGRIDLPPDPIIWIEFNLKNLGADEAPLNHAVATLSRQLACPHQDPADRFIAATAIHYGLHLVTVDQNLINTPSLQVISE